MEEKENFASAFVLKNNDAPVSFHVASRNGSESAVPFTGGNEPVAPAPVTLTTPAPATETPAPAMAGASVKKKRGRPRKYGPDGSSMALALSPMPISSSIPLTGEFSGGWKRGRGRGRSVESMKSFNKCEFESSGAGR